MQKDIVEQIGIPPSTFTRAKKSGFYNNPKVYDALVKYFKINEDYSYLSELEKKLIFYLPIFIILMQVNNKNVACLNIFTHYLMEIIKC